MRIVLSLLFAFNALSHSSVIGVRLPCLPRQYRKSGTCIPCTNCHSQGLEVLSPCSSIQDEICRIPVYGLAKIYSSDEGEITPGPTHRVRQRVLRAGTVRGIEKLRNAVFYGRRVVGDEEGGVNGRIRYEEDDYEKTDSLHSDLEAIEQELMREKARENELKYLLGSTTVAPSQKLKKELRRRRKKKNKKNRLNLTTSTMPGTTTIRTPSTTTSATTATTSTTTTITTTTATTTVSTTQSTTSSTQDFIQEQVFGQIIQESSNVIKKMEPVDVLFKEERNYSSNRSPSVLRPSKEIFGVSTKTWTIIASLIGALAFIVICILVGLKRVYAIQAFKLLDNRGVCNSGNSCSGSSGKEQPYVQSLVTSRTSSFHRSTESRLTGTSTLPASPNNSSPSSPNNKKSETSSSPSLNTIVDSSGRTSIRRAPARELPV